jgi:IS5 family transposase
VHLNLAYRWFCGLGLDGEVPDHSTFSKNRHGRFRDSDLLRRLFETVLQRCIDEGLVGGEGFAVDASLIQADASDRLSSAASSRRSQRHDALSRQQAGLPELFTEAEVRSERARPKDPALHP